MAISLIAFGLTYIVVCRRDNHKIVSSADFFLKADGPPFEKMFLHRTS